MADWYINADTGDDGAGDGSSGNPWETFVKANTEASNGDTVYVMAATAIYAFVTIAALKALTIQGDSPSTSVFDGNNLAARWKFTTASDDVVTNDLTFQNITTVDDEGIFHIAAVAGSSWTFERCIINHVDIIDGDAVRKGGMIQFKNAGAGCFYVLTSCSISDVFISGPNGYIFSQVDGNVDATIDVIECSIYLKEAGATQVTSITKAAMTVTWKNSIVMDKVSIAIGNSTNVATYSDFHNVTGAPAGTGVITSDPLFVDPDNENFNLRPTSPCIDTGTLV